MNLAQSKIDILIAKVKRLKKLRDAEQVTIDRKNKVLFKIKMYEYRKGESDYSLLRKNAAKSVKRLAVHHRLMYLNEIDKLNALICQLREIKHGRSKKSAEQLIETYVNGK